MATPPEPRNTVLPASRSESCMRCGAAMEWRHGTWQCGKCRFKLGCCEGRCGEEQ